MAKYYEYLGLEYKEKTEYTMGGRPITYLVRTTREPLPPDVKCKFCGSLDIRNKTPAEVARVKLPVRNWTELVRKVGKIQ